MQQHSSTELCNLCLLISSFFDVKRLFLVINLILQMPVAWAILFNQQSCKFLQMPVAWAILFNQQSCILQMPVAWAILFNQQSCKFLDDFLQVVWSPCYCCQKKKKTPQDHRWSLCLVSDLLCPAVVVLVAYFSYASQFIGSVFNTSGYDAPTLVLLHGMDLIFLSLMFALLIKLAYQNPK